MFRLFVFLAVISAVLHAQTPDTSTILGHVVDQSHAGVAGVTITVANSQTGLKRTAQTDGAGDFSLAGLPVAGSYSITASKQGFADATLDHVTLVGGASADVSLQLNVASGQSQITVTGVAGEVRADEPQLGQLLDTRQMDATPLLNSRITYLPMLNAANRPAINQGDVFMNENLFTTNGAGRRQAWFEVDGSTANDSWGRQTIFSNLPRTALQEMSVLTNAFSAEYGGSTGSVINMVTKSGGNHLHGDVFELWRPAATAAALSGFTATSSNATGNTLTSDTLGQSAVSLGGPLGSAAATHFFVAGEFSREDKTSPVISPVAPGNFVGHYRGWLAFVRLDHQLNDRNNLFFRGNLDGFHDTNPNGAVGGNSLPSVDRVFRRRTYSSELGETAVLSPTLLNSIRLQFQLASPITEFDPVIYGTQYSVPISTGGTFTSGTSQSALLLNRQYQVNDTLSASWGAHQVKFGADMIVAHTGGNSKEFGGPIYLGQFVYNTCTQALSVCESSAYLGNIANVKTYTQSYGNANYTVTDTLWSLFVQDDYRVRRDLTVNLGLRYEQQTFTDSRKDFAPRLGFAYNLHGDARTVLRGGFGIYYSQIVDNSAANWALTGPTGVFNYTAAPGQIGFPASVSAVPIPAFPAGAQAPLRSLYIRPGDASINQYLPTSSLIGYQNQLLNPYSEQWTFGVERRLGNDWVLAVDYVGSHTLRINRPLDVDPPSPFVRITPGQTRTPQAANCTRPYWILWYSQHGMTCNPAAATNPQPPYAVIQSDVNDGYSYYDALDVNLSHHFSRRLSMLASFTWSHAIDNVDPDVPGQNPNDPNFTGRIENGNAIFDQRRRFVLSGVYELPFRIQFGGVASLASGLPYNLTTGTTNSGDTGATTDRPVINGVVVGRNTGHGRPIYDISPFLERAFGTERLHVTLRAEAFNAFNHANFAGYSGTYGNGAAAGPGFGAPLVGITNQLPARSFQFSVKVAF
ncbi:MAG TPA: TonB-dependent receptor [Bryobacteraceae bacterium]|nr:TonB-dependent receptor [Bryobacteraceae bacterium]